MHRAAQTARMDLPPTSAQKPQYKAHGMLAEDEEDDIIIESEDDQAKLLHPTPFKTPPSSPAPASHAHGWNKKLFD